MTKNFALFALIALASSVSLTGCGTARSDDSADINRVNYPIVKEYDDVMLDQAADELEGGSCPALSNMVVDYGQMRDETRVLLGESVDVNR